MAYIYSGYVFYGKKINDFHGLYISSVNDNETKANLFS